MSLEDIAEQKIQNSRDEIFNLASKEIRKVQLNNQLIAQVGEAYKEQLEGIYKEELHGKTQEQADELLFQLTRDLLESLRYFSESKNGANGRLAQLIELEWVRTNPILYISQDGLKILRTYTEILAA